MSLSLIRSHPQTAGEHVGDILWWTLEDARVTQDGRGLLPVPASRWVGSCLAALREYLRRPAGKRTTRAGAPRTGSPIDALVEAAKADRIYSVVRSYLEALA